MTLKLIWEYKRLTIAKIILPKLERFGSLNNRATQMSKGSKAKEQITAFSSNSVEGLNGYMHKELVVTLS